MIEGSIAQSIEIWSDLNRFSIHESILLEIFFRNSVILSNPRFTIHQKIGILNRFSILLIVNGTGPNLALPNRAALKASDIAPLSLSSPCSKP